MQITIDTNNLSEMDINMLAFLAEQGEPVEVEEAADEPEPEPDPKPSKKKAAAKKATTKKADPEPEPDPEPESEDDSDGPTMSDAVAAATQLVSSGEAAKVKAALAEVGAKRVSEMDESDIPAFLAALEDEG